MRLAFGFDDFAYRPFTDDAHRMLPELLLGGHFRFGDLAIMMLLSRRREAHLFDVSAHIGAFVCRLKREIPWLEVHAYEPEISNFHHLCYNIGHLSGVHLQRKAAGEANRLVKLVISEHTMKHRIRLQGEGTEVEMVDLLGLLNRHRNRQSFITLKVDLSRYEYPVLRLLDLGPVDLLVLEGCDGFVNPSPLVTTQGLTFWFHPFGLRRHAVYVRKYPGFMQEMLR